MTLLQRKISKKILLDTKFLAFFFVFTPQSLCKMLNFADLGRMWLYAKVYNVKFVEHG